jgi:hypothetical protein
MQKIHRRTTFEPISCHNFELETKIPQRSTKQRKRKSCKLTIEKAMVLTAEYKDKDEAHVRLLEAPTDSAPGDVVFLTGEKQPQPVKELKSATWDNAMKNTAVLGQGPATGGKNWVTAKGLILAAGAPEGSIIK